MLQRKNAIRPEYIQTYDYSEAPTTINTPDSIREKGSALVEQNKENKKAKNGMFAISVLIKEKHRLWLPENLKSRHAMAVVFSFYGDTEEVSDLM